MFSVLSRIQVYLHHHFLFWNDLAAVLCHTITITITINNITIFLQSLNEPDEKHMHGGIGGQLSCSAEKKRHSVPEQLGDIWYQLQLMCQKMYQNVLAVSETLCKVDGGDVSSWREVPVDSELQMGLGGGMGDGMTQLVENHQIQWFVRHIRWNGTVVVSVNDPEPEFYCQRYSDNVPGFECQSLIYITNLTVQKRYCTCTV